MEDKLVFGEGYSKIEIQFTVVGPQFVIWSPTDPCAVYRITREQALQLADELCRIYK
jgi:hypothetical protein